MTAPDLAWGDEWGSARERELSELLADMTAQRDTLRSRVGMLEVFHAADTNTLAAAAEQVRQTTAENNALKTRVAAMHAALDDLSQSVPACEGDERWCHAHKAKRCDVDACLERAAAVLGAVP